MSFEHHCSVIDHDPIPHGDCTTVCSRCGLYHRYDHGPRISDRVYVNKALAVMAYRKAAATPAAPKIRPPSSEPRFVAVPRRPGASLLPLGTEGLETFVAVGAVLLCVASTLAFLVVGGWISP